MRSAPDLPKLVSLLCLTEAAIILLQRLHDIQSRRLQEARARDQDRDAGAGLVRALAGRRNQGQVRALAQHVAAQGVDAVETRGWNEPWLGLEG